MFGLVPFMPYLIAYFTSTPIWILLLQDKKIRMLQSENKRLVFEQRVLEQEVNHLHFATKKYRNTLIKLRSFITSEAT